MCLNTLQCVLEELLIVYKTSQGTRESAKKGSVISYSLLLQLNRFLQSVNLMLNVIDPSHHHLTLLSLPLVVLSHWVPLFSELIKGVVSVFCAPRSLKGVGDLSARRALNNRAGRNKRNKHHRPSVLQQQREDTGITMPEPVPQGTHILFVKALFIVISLETWVSVALLVIEFVCCGWRF